MPLPDPAYTPFVAMHEDRLVRSLVSETGLSPTAARAVAADVLPVAYQRSFTCAGAAYGWLRVAARHRAADSGSWAEAADAALGQAGPAAAALAGLPAADRELLRLRYVEGLLPVAIAERLGTTVDDVIARLDRARGSATRSLTPRRTLPVPLPRAAAALAAAAAAAFVTFGGGSSAPGQPPAVAGRAPSPSVDVVLPEPASPADHAPGSAGDRGGSAAGRAATGAPSGGVVTLPGRTGDPDRVPGGACRTRCKSPRTLTDELHVHVPGEIAEVVGEKELVVKQEVAQDVVSVCDTVPAIPAGVASCVPAEH